MLEENGKSSSGKRTRALNIRYFFLTDQIEKGNLNVIYCPTADMVADFMSKPLQGEKFIKFKNIIMGIDPKKAKEQKLNKFRRAKAGDRSVLDGRTDRHLIE